MLPLSCLDVAKEASKGYGGQRDVERNDYVCTTQLRGNASLRSGIGIEADGQSAVGLLSGKKRFPSSTSNDLAIVHMVRTAAYRT